MPASLSTIERVVVKTAETAPRPENHYSHPAKGYEYKILPLNDTDGITGTCHALNELAAAGYRVVPIQVRAGVLLLERKSRP